MNSKSEHKYLQPAVRRQIAIRGVGNGRALGIYRILIKITQKQWIKDEYILNIGSVLILFVLLTVYRLDLF